MNKITKNHIVASDGMTLIRKSNGEVMGKELWLGKTYWLGGERCEPFDEVAENFGEIADEDVPLQMYTYKAKNALEAVCALADNGQWLFAEDYPTQTDTDAQTDTGAQRTEGAASSEDGASSEQTDDVAEQEPKCICHDDAAKLAVIEKFGGITQTDYDSLTTALIRVSYSADKMEAIVNNHLYDMANVEHEREWLMMQEWRIMCKELAKDIMALQHE